MGVFISGFQNVRVYGTATRCKNILHFHQTNNIHIKHECADSPEVCSELFRFLSYVFSQLDFIVFTVAGFKYCVKTDFINFTVAGFKYCVKADFINFTLAGFKYCV